MPPPQKKKKKHPQKTQEQSSGEIGLTFIVHIWDTDTIKMGGGGDTLWGQDIVKLIVPCFLVSGSWGQDIVKLIVPFLCLGVEDRI